MKHNTASARRTAPSVAVRWPAAAPIVLAGAFLVLVGALLLWRSMQQSLDHDENQFIASGALLARHGLLPYRDYPYFHMPGLVFVYAALFKASDHLLLVSRAFSTVCSIGIVATVFLLTLRLCRGQGRAIGALAAAGASLVLVTNPNFVRTSGLAWNHDSGTLLALLAFLAVVGAPNCRRPGWWLATAGVLIGLAVAIRLTFAPSIAALAVVILLRSAAPLGRRLRGCGMFGAGVAAALGPVFMCFALAPQQFVFGNFVYPRLNTAFYRASGHWKAMDSTGKVRYLLVDVLLRPGNLLLAGAFVASLVFAFVPRKDRAPHPHRRELLALLVVLVGLLAGAFAPAPMFHMYFFAPAVFVLLFVIYAAAPDSAALGAHRLWRWSLRAAVVAGIALGSGNYLELLAHPGTDGWIPLQAHSLGREVHRLAGTEPVFTYAPVLVLEGGGEIFTPWATGPFAARIAPLSSAADRQAQHLVGANEPAWNASWPHPVVTLTGLEHELDKALGTLAGNDAKTVPFVLDGKLLRLKIRENPAALAAVPVDVRKL